MSEIPLQWVNALTGAFQILIVILSFDLIKLEPVVCTSHVVVGFQEQFSKATLQVLQLSGVNTCLVFM